MMPDLSQAQKVADLLRETSAMPVPAGEEAALIPVYQAQLMHGVDVIETCLDMLAAQARTIEADARAIEALGQPMPKRGLWARIWRRG